MNAANDTSEPVTIVRGSTLESAASAATASQAAEKTRIAREMRALAEERAA